MWIHRREYDPTKPVQVYKNLHNGLWSIRQRGLVVAHSDEVYLKDVTYKVSEKGRQRVLKEKRKNVHAFVVGYLCSAKDIREATAHLADYELKHCGVTYNPYKYSSFVTKIKNSPIHKSDFVDMDLSDLTPVLAIWK